MVSATEGLLSEVAATSTADCGVFIPVLVTNAEMFVAHFDPKQIDLSSGTIDKCQFRSASVVRYRKALDASRNSERGFPAHLGELNGTSQRSILVVNSREFSAFVESMKMPPDSWNGDYPWTRTIQEFRRRKTEPN